MRVFVTGATGTLGRPTVKKLIEEGHEVHALARSDHNVKMLDEMGAGPVKSDLFDSGALKEAVSGFDAILHLATRIPPVKEASKRGIWRENDRIRAEGTRILVDAALSAGVKSIIYPSVCFFYPDRGSEWIDVVEPDDPPALLLSCLSAEKEIERFTAQCGRGVVLRIGAFYSPDAPNTKDTIALARRGLALMFGRSDAYFSQIWVEDAASAVAAALKSAPAGTYNVVDDEPLTRGEVISLVAHSVGRRRLLKPPVWLIRALAGRDALFAARSQRVSNRKFKEATGWCPRVPSAREGWAQIAEVLDSGA